MLPTSRQTITKINLLTLKIIIMTNLTQNTETNNTIKTIDIQAKEWFDKVNGNSYFAALITLNFGMSNEKTIKVPFQYGYGYSSRYKSIEQLQKDGILPNEGTLQRDFFTDNNIIVRYSKQENCKKSELKNI